MKRTLVILSVIVLAACAISQSTGRPRPLAPADLYAHAHAACVEIFTRGHLEGSGWFADDQGHIVTAAHAVYGVDDAVIEVLTSTGRRIGAKIVALDRGHDIALLKIEGPVPAHMPVADTRPAPTTPVYVYGAALYHHHLMITGNVARNTDSYAYYPARKQPVRFYYVTAPSPPGTSGGPWINAAGQVVGNQSGFVTHNGAGAGIAMLAPPEAIRRLVTEKTSATSPLLGCGVEELWTQSAGFIKRLPKGTEGLVTIPITKGGPIDKAGLNTESIITAVEGKPIRYRNDLYDVVWSKKPGDVVTLTVQDPDDKPLRQVKVTLGALEK